MTPEVGFLQAFSQTSKPLSKTSAKHPNPYLLEDGGQSVRVKNRRAEAKTLVRFGAFSNTLYCLPRNLRLKGKMRYTITVQENVIEDKEVGIL